MAGTSKWLRALVLGLALTSAPAWAHSPDDLGLWNAALSIGEVDTAYSLERADGNSV